MSKEVRKKKVEAAIELPRPSEEEVKEILEQHRGHLIELRRGTVMTPFGIVKGEDYYCHTCKRWLQITTKMKFQSKPRKIGKKASWLGGEPDDLDIIAKTFNLSEKEKKLWKLSREDPKAFRLLMKMWLEDDIKRDLKRLMEKYGISKDEVIKLLEEMSS